MPFSPLDLTSAARREGFSFGRVRSLMGLFKTTNREGKPMLFCLTADYTPQALNAMRENPNTNRQAAVEQVLKAAGGALVSMDGRATNGPGVMVIFDVPDPAMAPAISGVAISAGSIQNVELTRLFTMEEMDDIRKKAMQLRGAYKPPGQQ